MQFKLVSTICYVYVNLVQSNMIDGKHKFSTIKVPSNIVVFTHKMSEITEYNTLLKDYKHCRLHQKHEI